MFWKNYLKRIITFSMTFVFGVMTGYVWQSIIYKVKVQKASENVLINKSTNKLVENKFQKKEKGSGFCSTKDNTNIGTGYGTGQSNGKYVEKRYFDMFVNGKPFTENIKSEKDFKENKKLKISYKPKPQYTEEAKKNNIEGSIVLRVVFLANGEIGAITPVSNLPCGLTGQAIEAAKKIRFEPQIVSGRPQSVIKSVKFDFTIY